MNLMANDNKLGFLNLKNHGDTATIRVLHSTPDTIEVEDTHWINFSDGTHKSVKCPGDGCPLCASKVSVNRRAYIHVIDLGDMQEKVWVQYTMVPLWSLISLLTNVKSNMLSLYSPPRQ